MDVFELNDYLPMNIVWQDIDRKLYMEGDEAILEYHNERYTFGCQPYEPMALIYRDFYIHIFYNDFQVKLFRVSFPINHHKNI